MIKAAPLQLVGEPALPQDDDLRLDQVFFALADPVRRSILGRLDGHALLVSELAAGYDISLQAVSRHIQVLVRAGLVQQARSGRISRCSLDVGPLYDAAVWLNRYSKYWQEQFDTLAAALSEIDAAPRRGRRAGGRRASRRK
ncbi:MAG TPA: metalloregulator ArsR/SmtB family transcription factor [Steroidobacteraceae bacterium]|nr:metalloregulator ArsR/SmtB family transcription factor [Steroidobacteraceae bacterium]